MENVQHDTVLFPQSHTYADVIVPLPLPQLFTYGVPQGQYLEKGCRVIVPFGRTKILTGIIARIHTQKPENYEVKSILEVLDMQPLVTEQQLQLLDWVAKYYLCTTGEVLQVALPTAFKLSSETRMQLHPQWVQHIDQPIDEREQLLINALQLSESIEIEKTAAIIGLKTYHKYIKSLIEKQLIVVYEAIREKYQPKMLKKVKLAEEYCEETALQQLFAKLEKQPKQLAVLMSYLQKIPIADLNEFNFGGIEKAVLLKHSQTVASYNTLVKKGVFTEFEVEISRFGSYGTALQRMPQLSDTQQEAAQSIVQQFMDKDVVLLHGITGSGKTEIYIDLIQKTLDNGNTVLYLLPEIALTAQIVSRLKKLFGDELAVYHSKFSDNERVEVWNGMLHGKYKILVGTRSALFLPFANLGLVLVDEEHDPSYKQHDPAPRFHARDTALILARLHHAKVLMGTATPSMETYHNALGGKYGLVTIAERYASAKLPQIESVAVNKKTLGEGIHFADETRAAIQQALTNSEQVIVFQNRRGYAPYLQCRNCEWIPTCQRCSVSLTYHKYSNELKCHYCGYKQQNPEKCTSCHSPHIQTMGLGTEKIEDELQILFPEARIQRLDLETTRTKHAFDDIFNNFAARKTDILVGTQMLSKGLDFDHVTLVVIADIDQLLHFPDFRSVERAFQLAVQVAGRAGRKDKAGKVIIQTRDIQRNEAFLELIKNYDYQSYYDKELAERQRYGFPPFTRLVKISLKHKEKQKAEQAALYMSAELRKYLPENTVLGPATPGISKINDYYIQELLVKFPKEYTTIGYAKEVIKNLENHLYTLPHYKGIRIVSDVDVV